MSNEYLPSATVVNKRINLCEPTAEGTIGGDEDVEVGGIGGSSRSVLEGDN